ncbi:MAG: hypothetical protein SNJ57_18765 [Cyanobacteriota bacterium]
MDLPLYGLAAPTFAEAAFLWGRVLRRVALSEPAILGGSFPPNPRLGDEARPRSAEAHGEAQTPSDLAIGGEFEKRVAAETIGGSLGLPL